MGSGIDLKSLGFSSKRLYTVSHLADPIDTFTNCFDLYLVTYTSTSHRYGSPKVSRESHGYGGLNVLSDHYFLTGRDPWTETTETGRIVMWV